ncbi:MAG TPA: NUDIX hydrolase [Candidatus Saccharimonadales bacterium]|jgi:ADP-ribose pyrophosphatase|nr:NUDIX hydrolase [Candidatus Saccharimonadales bacterium]
MMQAWKRIEPTKVQKMGFRTVVSKTFKLPDGNIATFDLKDAEGSEAAVVIALTDNNRVIVARQFRPGPEMIMEELPGGGVEPGEDKEAAVRRELLEETGYEAGEVTFLGTAYYDAYTNGQRHCFLATGCTLSVHGVNPGEHEFIDLQLISIDELLDNARHGKLTDPAAVLMAYERLQKIKEAS